MSIYGGFDCCDLEGGWCEWGFLVIMVFSRDYIFSVVIVLDSWEDWDYYGIEFFIGDVMFD